MFRILFILFILVPIIDIGVFIQVGDQLGLSATIAIVIITAILGVNLLKQQGFVAIRDIQTSLNQGKMPALELASGAQLLIAGVLLLTPGFVTDSIGFLLMIPAVRLSLAQLLISKISLTNINSGQQNFSQSHFHYSQTEQSQPAPSTSSTKQGRVFEGELAQDEAIEHRDDKI